MSSSFAPIVPARVPCKVCGAAASLYGVVDFHKNCEVVRKRNVFAPSGIPIYYHRCSTCQLIFTVAFDRFSHEDFAKHIYNEQYALVDPDYANSRPVNNSKNVAMVFGRNKSVRLLDYGAGSGKLAELLRADGFSSVLSYDPFVSTSAARPDGKFDVITCYEVVEHSPDPRKTFADMFSMLAVDGLLMFSTCLQDEEFARDGINWWYIAPRNGHVTIFSQPALERLAKDFSCQLRSYKGVIHFMFRKQPSFVNLPAM